MSIDGLYSSRGRFHIMSLVSIENNIESVVHVAAILDYVNSTLPAANGDDHIGFPCQFNVNAGLIFFIKYNSTIILNCTVRPSGG